jgi:hypothetical protein
LRVDLERWRAASSLPERNGELQRHGDLLTPTMVVWIDTIYPERRRRRMRAGIVDLSERQASSLPPPTVVARIDPERWWLRASSLPPPTAAVWVNLEWWRRLQSGSLPHLMATVTMGLLPHSSDDGGCCGPPPSSLRQRQCGLRPRWLGSASGGPFFSFFLKITSFID